MAESDSLDFGEADDVLLPTQQWLSEILQSYIVLFGQHPRSRNLFKVEKQKLLQNFGTQDPLLEVLCLATELPTWISPSKKLIRRSVYPAGEVFPMLGQQLEQLQIFAGEYHPKTLLDFWRDRRDPFSFWSFWGVIGFGAITIILSLAQTGLSAGQLYYANSPGG